MVKTMDKNRELAELMGYQHHEGPIGEGWFAPPATGGMANWKSIDFDTDLNAMAEVEKVIAKKSNRHKYAEMVRNRIGAYYEEHLTGTIHGDSPSTSVFVEIGRSPMLRP